MQINRRIANVDGQFSGRLITVTVSDGVREYLLHAARRTRIAHVAVLAVGADSQRAIQARHRKRAIGIVRNGAAGFASDIGYRGAIGALRVLARAV